MSIWRHLVLHRRLFSTANGLSVLGKPHELWIFFVPTKAGGCGNNRLRRLGLGFRRRPPPFPPKTEI